MGKRICIGLEDDLWLILHLMIAGRLHWSERGAKLTRPRGLAAFDFPDATLLLDRGWLTKSARRSTWSQVKITCRSSIREAWKSSTPTSINSPPLQSENHTLKRALTDPRMFSGIGNAYSDEILWEACLSPMQLTQKMTRTTNRAALQATRSTLEIWVDRLRVETGDKFPEKVTAFREDMAVHGKYKQKCPRCGNVVQRIRYAANEANYCPHCQTGDKLLADRALSRLLRDDWPKTPDALESFIDKRRSP